MRRTFVMHWGMDGKRRTRLQLDELFKWPLFIVPVVISVTAGLLLVEAGLHVVWAVLVCLAHTGVGWAVTTGMVFGLAADASPKRFEPPRSAVLYFAGRAIFLLAVFVVAPVVLPVALLVSFLIDRPWRHRVAAPKQAVARERRSRQELNRLMMVPLVIGPALIGVVAGWVLSELSAHPVVALAGGIGYALMCWVVGFTGVLGDWLVGYSEQSAWPRSAPLYVLRSALVLLVRFVLAPVAVPVALVVRGVTSPR